MDLQLFLGNYQIQTTPKKIKKCCHTQIIKIEHPSFIPVFGCVSAKGPFIKDVINQGEGGLPKYDLT